MASVSNEEYLNCIRCILQSENEDHYEVGFKKLGKIESVIDKYNGRRVLKQLLTEQPIKNIHFLPPILTIMCTRHNIAPSINSIITFLHQSAASFQNKYCLSAVLSWLNNSEAYLQSCRSDQKLKLGGAVMETLFWMKLPSTMTQKLKFYQDLEAVDKFLQNLYKIITNKGITKYDLEDECAKAILSQVYNLMFNWGQKGLPPSPALIVVLQLLSPNLLARYVEKVINNWSIFQL